jgi:Ca2+-binding RTX toxin-like protein
MPIRTAPLALIVILVSLLLATAAANAATLEVVNGTAVFTAAPGETNDVRMTSPLTLTDAGAPLTAGPGCEQLDANSARCAEETRGQLPLVVSTGDRNDRAYLADDCCRNISLRGGPGNDALYVSSNTGTPAELDGGPGNDELTANEQLGAVSVLRGGPGDDTLTLCCETNLGGREYGGDGNDRLVWAGNTGNFHFPLVLDGGYGNDTYAFETNFVPGAMVAGPGLDTLDETTASRPGFFYVTFVFDVHECPGCVERVIATPYDDRIAGDDSAQAILGGDGDDVLDGGRGPDVLSGDAGDDSITSRDGTIDFVRCGAGADTVVADRRDLVSPDCENVTRAQSGV